MEVANDKQKLISSFVEIAVGQTMESAKLFLEATCWNLEDAINLYLINRNYQVLPNQTSSEQNYYDYQGEGIPPPLPSKKDILYDPYSMHQPSKEVCSSEVWESESPESDSKLASLYRPPMNLLFKGSFEEAKLTTSRDNLWLLVNLQSKTEFASHTLNRDIWSDKAVSEVIVSSFILWQAYDDTDEGKKISTFYKIDSVPPVVLLIDPITGQKVRSWSGVIEAQGFVEDLMGFIEVGPHEWIASVTSKKRRRTEPITCVPRNHTEVSTMSTFGRDELKDSVKRDNKRIKIKPVTCFPSKYTDQDVSILSTYGRHEREEGANLVFSQKEETCWSSKHSGQVLAPSWGHEFEETMTSPELEEDTCLKFPDLTEEPKGDCDRSLVCNICIRFPDGRRKQRRFLKSEPIQLLWSFCHSHMEESEEKRFKLVHAIPGASKTLDYGANTTLEQSGIANSTRNNNRYLTW